MLTLTPDQLDILRHMLGINTPDDRSPKPYRDYYCANTGDANLHELQRVGAVRLYRTIDSYEWFCCTDAGRAAAMASHRTIRRSKARRVYSKFLDLRECWPDLTFREFLTNPELRETRLSA